MARKMGRGMSISDGPWADKVTEISGRLVLFLCNSRSAVGSWNARESNMWKGKKRFGGGSGGEPAAKRQAAGDDGPSESADEGIVVAEVTPPTPVLSY